MIGDVHPTEWAKVRAWIDKRLALHGKTLLGDHDPIVTATLRGGARELQAMIDHFEPKEAPSFEKPDLY